MQPGTANERRSELWMNRGAWKVAVRSRHCDAELVNRLIEEKGLSDIAARVVAGRGVTPNCLWPTLGQLDPPFLLPDIAKAAALIADAVMHSRPIVSASDSDSDGNSAQAIIYEALTEYFHMPPSKVLAIAGHKLKSGYGLTSVLAEKIAQWRKDEPKLIVTSDMGSSDEPRIRWLKEQGHTVVVTDHHEFPLVDGKPTVPASADAVVSPARPDSRYPDRKIAGCYVAFIVMMQVRNKLMQTGYLPEDAPKLTPLLGIAALGTLVDCVSMASSKNNRAVVLAGLRQIRQGNRPCWRVAKAKVRGNQVTSADLAFLLGPACNAFSRVGEPLGGARFFLAKSRPVAEFWWTALEKANETRKEIEREMTDQVIALAAEQDTAGRSGIVAFLEDGHPGIHGISAARAMERFGKPCGVFSPQHGSEEMLSGSFRTVEGFHLKQGFEAISQANPEVFPPGSYGGHAGAGGARLRREHLETFTEMFDAEVRRQTQGRKLYPIHECDGILAPGRITPELVHELESLEPYGREFPDATFLSEFKVLEVRRIGKQKEHLSLTLQGGGRTFRAVWFFVEGLEPKPGDKRVFVHTPQWNYWNGRQSLQLRISGMQLP